MILTEILQRWHTSLRLGVDEFFEVEKSVSRYVLDVEIEEMRLEVHARYLGHIQKLALGCPERIQDMEFMYLLFARSERFRVA